MALRNATKSTVNKSRPKEKKTKPSLFLFLYGVYKV